MDAKTDVLTENQKLTIRTLQADLRAFIDHAISDLHMPIEPWLAAVEAKKLLDGPEPQKADKALYRLSYIDPHWLTDDATEKEKQLLELTLAIVSSRKEFKIAFDIKTPC